MSDCNGNCSSCETSDGCESKSMIEPTNKFNKIKKVIPIVSGKGGVGKSMSTAYLATLLSREGYKVGILDADITGPSIPKMFGATGKATSDGNGINPIISKNGIKLISLNLLIDDHESPVLWRGPMIAGAVKQFWTDVLWGELDYLLIDMPPGTGDVPLTVFQSIPVDGIVIVTSPQDLVSMIVKKAYNMAKMMNISVLGIIENMSFVECPDCGKQIKVFGEGTTDKQAANLELDVLAKIPIDPDLAKLCDEGKIEKYNKNYFNKIEF